MKRIDLKRLLAGLLVPLLIAVVSGFIVAPIAADPASHEASIQLLDEKEKTVLELTTASTAASLAASALPGDMGTPIADKMTDLSTGFLLVLCVLYLEKYLLTITGFAAFRVLIPLAMGLYLVYCFYTKEWLAKIARKVVVFALAIFLLVPASVQTSRIIEETYQASIQETIDDARELSADLEEEEKSQEKGDKAWYEEVADWAGGVKDQVSHKVGGWIGKAEEAANGILEALAVMLVTSCVIPLLVVLAFIWIFKLIFSIDIPISNVAAKRRACKEEFDDVSPSDN